MFYNKSFSNLGLTTIQTFCLKEELILTKNVECLYLCTV